MLFRSINSTAALFLTLSVSGAVCQLRSRTDSSSHARKDWELGRPRPDSPAALDGGITDAAILEYVQELSARLARAAGAPEPKVRVTRSTQQYESFVTGDGLYISAGLLDRTEHEAELAGLLAHGLAHTPQASPHLRCVLASPLLRFPAEGMRERERQATAAAMSYMKTAGYDPAGVLDILSKLAYEHPAWSKAIHPEDLLELRARSEREPMPQAGYRLDSSGYMHARSSLETILHSVPETPSLSRRH